MAVTYGEVSQSDHDDDRNDAPSPSASFSPTHSSSPFPFLPAAGSTYTPLSMDSDLVPGGHTNGSEIDGSRDKVSGKPRLTINSMVQSLRTSDSAKQVHANGYDPLSPSDAASSVYSSPNRAPLSPAGDSSYYDASSKHAIQQPVAVKPTPIRTASTKSVALRHPTPDLVTRSSSRASNIAQLEATAEQLSMTSSIDDAIRELHEEQKRNDSRRSSVLATSIGSIPETDEPVNFPVSRQVSAASSILETNNAARLGGYSPAAYVMSPNHSLRSGNARAVTEGDNTVARHGPGKSSVRSVRSATKPALMNIAEMEPTSLNIAALDAADRLPEHPEEEDNLRVPQMEDVDLTPNADQYQSYRQDYWGDAVQYAQQDYGNEQPRAASAGSGGTFEQAERAFADFDGAHCSPDVVDFEDSLNLATMFATPSAEEFTIPPFNPHGSAGDRPVSSDPSFRAGATRPPGHYARPKSYLDPQTGDQMLYYPARVPVMLNLPEKLSKKPKAEARERRRSQILNATPEANRQSRASFLPEFAPQIMAPLMSLSDDRIDPTTLETINLDADPPARPATHGRSESQPLLRPKPLVDAEARKSRMSVMDFDKRQSRDPAPASVPPQLRASAFFELPSESTPALQLKDGSAMATLDSILDASAKAPVSAFTDHAFAGSLGTETYGTEKKRKSHLKRSSVATLLEPKKRSSFLHLRKPSALSRHSDKGSQEERRDTITGPRSPMSLKPDDIEAEERQHLAGSVDGEPVPAEDEQEGSDDEALYNGPPTTLLAELQMRKHQQKLRTRHITDAFPHGMHSTLLEMDTVAEVERRARKDKRVNLAWEAQNVDGANDSDDEDTPLALLAAAKGQQHGLIGAISDINRPPGLMQKRDMEDNEPLSARRNRLQGREVGPPRRLAPGQGLSMSGGLGPPSPQPRLQTPDDDEVEGETLGERMRRLRAREDGDNPLPRARPVSTAFSVELLSQLGDAFMDEAGAEAEKDKQKTPQPEEDETLGQRRRRLQAERELRDRELAGAALNGQRLSVSPRLLKRHSLADVLGAHGTKAVRSDPRAEAERAKQDEAARYKREQDQKFAALRGSLPASQSSPNLVRSGGYLAGRYNDGTGGGTGQPRINPAMSSQFGGTGMRNQNARASMMGNAFAMGGAMSNYNMPPGYTAPLVNPSYPTAMPMQPAGQMDRVERWRQSIFP
ncbi:hypothetical protein F4780DRAFT_406682 [Xylariomycetidae sp. FL0641]|nr:hypothetical protein F4780DRAFT_406682 [Xylariomycetidae sp. FL0641]